MPQPSHTNTNHTIQYYGITFPNNFNILCETFFMDRIFPKSKIFGRHIAKYKNWKKSFDADYLQGSCLLIRKKLLDEIGIFDENFFLYFEETDLCYRAKKNGWRIHRSSNSEIVHFGSGEVGYYDRFRIYQYHKSLFLFFVKHYRKTDIIFLKTIIFTRAIIRICLLCLMGIFLRKKRNVSFDRVKGYLSVFSSNNVK